MSRNAFKSIVGLLFVSVLIVAAGASAGQTTPTAVDASKLKNPVKATPESIAAGQAAFGKYCKFCHGADAKGNGPLAPKGTNPPDLTDATWTHGSTDGEIFSNIRNGIGPKFDMKANSKDKIPDTEVWNIVNYLRSIGPGNGKK